MSFIKKKWVVNKKDNIVLYTRLVKFSETKLPDETRIKNLINKAIESINEINNFNSDKF